MFISWVGAGFCCPDFSIILFSHRPAFRELLQASFLECQALALPFACFLENLDLGPITVIFFFSRVTSGSSNSDSRDFTPRFRQSSNPRPPCSFSCADSRPHLHPLPVARHPSGLRPLQLSAAVSALVVLPSASLSFLAPPAYMQRSPPSLF